LHFQDQTPNAYAFLLINESLNKDKVPNLTTNHRSPRAKRFVNYALKTRMEGVARVHLQRKVTTQSWLFQKKTQSCFYLQKHKNVY
jgi:hypothetical protein